MTHKVRGNGQGSIYFLGRGRRRPWKAVVTVGYASDRPVRVSRSAFTREEAEESLSELRRDLLGRKDKTVIRYPDAPGSGPFAARRFAALERDGFACRYCGRRPPEVELQVDHILPVAAGGTDDLANLAAACEDCNLGKADRVLGA